jgi:hypothetical protein
MTSGPFCGSLRLRRADLGSPRLSGFWLLPIPGDQAIVRGLRGPGQRVPDPAAGQVVSDGGRDAAAVLTTPRRWPPFRTRCWSP